MNNQKGTDTRGRVGFYQKTYFGSFALPALLLLASAILPSTIYALGQEAGFHAATATGPNGTAPADGACVSHDDFEWSPPANNPPSLTSVPAKSTAINVWWSYNSHTHFYQVYYKWSTTAVDNSDPHGDTTWRSVVSAPEGCDTNSGASTSLGAAETSFAVPNGGPYYLHIYQNVYESASGATGQAFGPSYAHYQIYVPSPTPPVITLSPSSGTFATTNPPAFIQVTSTGAAPITTASYSITGPAAQCNTNGAVSTTTGGNPASFQATFSQCGIAGTYSLTTTVTDSGLKSATKTASYTLSDIQPTNFHGIATSDKIIAYTWTKPGAAVDHYQLMLNDPSGANPAGSIATIDGAASSFNMDFTSVLRLPFGNFGPDFLSSATLRSCLDTGCGSFSDSDSDSHYTWADPVSNTSVQPFSSTATIVFDTTPNLMPDPVSSPKGTAYQIAVSSNDFASSSLTSNIVPTSTPWPVSVNLKANASYKYLISSINGDVAGVAHITPMLSPSPVFWTLPAAPSTVFNTTVTATAVQGNFTFPDNADPTQYVMQASLAADFSSNVFSSGQIPQQPAGATGTGSLTGLASGSYFLRACAISLDPSTNGALTCGPSSQGLFTNKAIPGAPFLSNGGTCSNLFITIAIATDTNSGDSLYAIEVTPPGSNAAFLTGVSGGTPVSGLSSSPVWFTKTDWAANGANQLLGVASNSIYQARVAVQEVFGGNQAVFGTMGSILTPGAVAATFTIPSGVTLDGVLFGVASASTLDAAYSSPIDPNSVNGKVTIFQGNQQSTVTVTSTNGNGGTVLHISPPGNIWTPNTVYKVSIAAGIMDTFGFTSTQTFTSTFLTAPNVNQDSTIGSPLVLDDPTNPVVILPGGQFSSGMYVVDRVKFVSPAGFVSRAGGPSNIASQGAISPLSLPVEVLIYCPAGATNCSGGTGQNTTTVPLTLKIGPHSAILLNNVDKTGLGIYVLDSRGLLTLVPGGTLNSDGTMSVQITQSGVYVLAGPVATALSGSHAWPVPYKPSAGHTVIHFVGLATDAVIKIYTITGELVNTLNYPNDNSNEMTWNVTNSDGEKVASGVYIYQIKNSFSEKRGKLIIIR